MMFIERFIIGLAGGPFCISAPQYIAEISQKEIRGTLSCFMELLQVSGILFAFIVGAGTSVFWLSVIGGVIPFIFGFIFYFMPESPIYLINEGRDLEATQSYKWLRGEEFDSSEETSLLEQPEDNLTFMETLKLPANKKAFKIGILLMFFQQISGINVVVFYATKIFEVKLFSNYKFLINLKIFSAGWNACISSIQHHYHRINGSYSRYNISIRDRETWPKGSSSDIYFSCDYLSDPPGNFLLYARPRSSQCCTYRMAAFGLLVHLHSSF